MGYNTNYNINHHSSDLDEHNIARDLEIDSGNDVLGERGYLPSLSRDSHDLAKARIVSRMDRETREAPNSLSAGGKSLLGGLLAGVGVGSATAGTLAATRLGHLAPLAPVAGIAGGVLAGRALYKHLYTDDLKKEDEARQAARTNILLAHLEKHYSKM